MTPSRRALVAGWFSFAEVVATVGDRLGADVTERWLREAGWDCDLALAPYLGEGVDWRVVDPAGYDLLVFTTGPIFADARTSALLGRFDGCARWAVNVSVVEPDMRERFDRIWPRDGAGAAARADLSFAESARGAVDQPVVAVAFVPPQREYRGGVHDRVRSVVTDWLNGDRLPALELDMDLYADHRLPRSPQQVTALISRADVVVSMRLHAAVPALAEGRPVIALDPIPRGGKVAPQMAAVEWPCVLTGAGCSAAGLRAAPDWCLSPEASRCTARSRALAAAQLDRLHAEISAAARLQPVDARRYRR